MDRLVSRQSSSRSKEKQRCIKRARSLMLTYGISVPDEWWEPESWDAIQKQLPVALAAQVGYWRGLTLEIQKGLDVTLPRKPVRDFVKESSENGRNAKQVCAAV